MSCASEYSCCSGTEISTTHRLVDCSLTHSRNGLPYDTSGCCRLRRTIPVRCNSLCGLLSQRFCTKWASSDRSKGGWERGKGEYGGQKNTSMYVSECFTGVDECSRLCPVLQVRFKHIFCLRGNHIFLVTKFDVPIHLSLCTRWVQLHLWRKKCPFRRSRSIVSFKVQDHTTRRRTTPPVAVPSPYHATRRCTN